MLFKVQTGCCIFQFVSLPTFHSGLTWITACPGLTESVNWRETLWPSSSSFHLLFFHNMLDTYTLFWLCVVGYLNKNNFPRADHCYHATFVTTKFLLCLKSLREAPFHNTDTLFESLSRSFRNYSHIISLPHYEPAIPVSPHLLTILQIPEA